MTDDHTFGEWLRDRTAAAKKELEAAQANGDDFQEGFWRGRLTLLHNLREWYSDDDAHKQEPMTDGEIAEAREALEELQEETQQYLADELGGDPDDYHARRHRENLERLADNEECDES